MPLPLLVMYMRPKNLRDLIFRAQIPKNILGEEWEQYPKDSTDAKKEAIVYYATTVAMLYHMSALSQAKKHK